MLRVFVVSLRRSGRSNISTKSLDLVRKTLPLVAEAGPAFTSHFYKRMFEANPELLNIFNISNQRGGAQQRALFNAVAESATSVLETGTLPVDLLETIAHKHCALNVAPSQYSVVGFHMLGTITDLLNPPVEVVGAWGELYGALADYHIKREEEIYSTQERKPGGWRGLRDFVVSAKRYLSEEVAEFTFTSKDAKPVCEFTPGQYTTIWTKPSIHIQPRHYSLIEKGENSYIVAIKKEPEGLVSSFLHDHMGKNDTVSLSPPMGNYTMEGVQKLWTTAPDTPVVLLSAGIGLTPALAMLSFIRQEERPITWLHATSNGTHHPYRSHLVHLGSKSKNFTRRVWYEHPNADDVLGHPNDNRAMFHFEGRMKLTQVANHLPQKGVYFLTGPTPWMKDVARQLMDLGVPRQNLHAEVFGPNEGGIFGA